MELVTLDPKILKPNPANPRQTGAGDHADAQLTANIRTLGILQPPVVRREHDEFIIVAGHRRIRAAIALDLPEILVLLREADDGGDSVRAVSENVVRAPLGPVDQWRAIEALSSDHWTDDAISAALALPVRTIKKLRLLAHIHPAMLDHIAKGDMPDERQLRVIAAASAQEQASVWKKHKPKKGQEDVYWREIARALEKRRIHASNAKFGPDEEQAFGIQWEDDLFAPADEDTRYTTNVEGFFAAQAAWLETNMPKNGIILPLDEYGHPKLPPKAERVWGTPKKSDSIGFYIDPRDGDIEEIPFRLAKPEPKKGKTESPASDDDDAPSPPARTRPDITQKGMTIIGELRTEALTKAILENTFDDTALIGMLLLALNANNVQFRTKEFTHDKRRRLYQAITEGGHLTQDIETLRRAARETLAHVLSCRTNYDTSGIAALFAGGAIGADAHLSNMATEEILSCLSKNALERAAADIGLPPGQRAKDTRAAIIKETAGTTFVLPNARFAPTEGQIAAHQAPVRSWEDYDQDDDDADADTGEDPQHPNRTGGEENSPTTDLISETGPSNFDDDQNYAEYDDENYPEPREPEDDAGPFPHL